MSHAGRAAPPVSDKDRAAEDFAEAAAADPDIIFMERTPPPDPGQHRRKRAAQWERWQRSVLPMLLLELARLLHETKSLRDLDGRRPQTLSSIEDMEIHVCDCTPAAVQLMQLGAFGCAPMLPSLAVDLRVLEFAMDLFLQISPNNTAFSLTLERVLANMGFQLEHQVSLPSLVPDRFANHEIAQNSLRRRFASLQRHHRHNASSASPASSSAATATPTTGRGKHGRESSPEAPQVPFPEPPPRLQPSEYLRRRCPACFGNLKHDPSQVLLLPRSVLDGCEASFKAADEKRQKASTEFFENTALMALVCRHDRVLWVANMHTAGERQFYVMALMYTLFQHLPHDIRVGLLYDVACAFERSCLKWGFLSPFMDQIAFVVSVFHAFGHEWACQLLYHPRKRVGFGYTNGEGCERFWQSIRHLIPHLRISGLHLLSLHRETWLIYSSIEHAQEMSLFRLAEGIHRRYRHSVQKRADATEALRKCGKPKTLLREQWKMQVIAQTKPLPRRSKTRGQQAVNAVMLLRAAVKTRQGQVRELRQRFLDAVQQDHPDAAMCQGEYLAIQQALQKAEGTLRRKEETLGVDKHEELEQLANSEYMRLRMNTRALKLRLRERLRVRKFEMDVVEHAYRRLLNDAKLRAHTESAVKRREPTIAKLVTEYNKLCAQMAKLICDRKAPSGSMAPIPIPPKALWQLDVDDAIFQDVGLDDRDDDNDEPPPWLCDEKVRTGIKAFLELDRCDEEDARLRREKLALRKMITEAIEGAGTSRGFKRDSILS
ncbi:hypothetical protein B0H19DRAFT_1215139 [Mycena capillaripes]|nr:hypothetical protein B0H19DRAFT_1215139 [Mycena capillaripes]